MLNGRPGTLKNHSLAITSEHVQLSAFPFINNIWNMLGADFEKKCNSVSERSYCSNQSGLFLFSLIILIKESSLLFSKFIFLYAEVFMEHILFSLFWDFF